MHYIPLIQSAIDYIEDNLNDEIQLAVVAERVGFSMFHFSRLFHLVVGETVISYIRGRRLARCAEELIGSEKRIIDIATEWGFSSQATFTRAFKHVYGVTPAVYRSNQTPLFIEKPRLTREEIEHRRVSFDTEPRITELDAFDVVGMRFLWRVCDGYRLREWWSRFTPQMGEIEGGDPSTLVGVCEYAAASEFTVDRSLRYVAGIPAPSGIDLPEDMIRKKVPAARYAVFSHRADVSTMLESCRFIFGVWLPNSDHEPIAADNFEIYSPQCFERGAREGEIEIFIPIK